MKTKVKHTTKILRLNHTDGGNESMAAKVPMGGLNTEPPQAPTNWRGITKELVVSVSAKHIHLTQGDVEILFGKGYELKPKAFLSSMPEQVGLHVGFASTDTVTIIGNKPGRKLENVRVLGPPRPYSQVELAYTDALKIGIDAPVRISGDYLESATCTLIGPKGRLEMKEGVIRAWRHIHMQDAHCHYYNVKTKDLIALKVNSPMCSIILDDVMVRSMNYGEENYKLFVDLEMPRGMEVHLDTDEGNACMLKDATSYELLKKTGENQYETLFKQDL